MIERIRYRLLLFRDTNKWMALVQAMLAKSRKQKVVVYNKYHPIYTDFFLHQQNGPIRWVYMHNSWSGSWAATMLIKLADAFHIDASGYHRHFEQPGKPLIVECEGLANGDYWKNSAVKAILFQSRYAGRMQLGEPGTQLLYPAVNAGRISVNKRSAEFFTLLTVGHGSFIKGMDVSYAIYKILRQRGHRVKLVIAGSMGHNFKLYPEVSPQAYAASGFEDMEKEMAADPDVVLRPFRRTELLRDGYPAANALLHFSRMETFGFTIMEAISFGVPVVSVKFKAIPEMVDHGKTGFLCNPFNWDGTSQLDELCMNNPQWREQCIAEGVEYVERLIVDKDLETSMRKAAQQKAKQFDFAARYQTLAALYSAGK
jgi:glycosyltransferase involved in cell wall biosynthesis